MSYILAIDQGTTGTTCSVMNARSGEIVSSEDKDFEQIFPKPGWVEHDLNLIWQTVEETAKGAIAKAQIRPSDIACIGITNQRETVGIWDRKSGQPLANAIVWQCRRTADFCNRLKKKKGLEKQIRTKTGLVIDAYFSGSKINWFLKNLPGALHKAKSGDLAIGTIDTFLIYKLTQGKSHVTDVSNASRTQLMNIATGEWDSSLLKVFGIPKILLPEIKPSSGKFGVTQGCSFLPNGIPITGVAGDQQSALFGQACFSPGEAKCTYGTGSFLLMNTGSKRVQSKQCLTTVAWKLSVDEPMVYALEGSVFVCGAAVQWLRDGMGFVKESAEIEKLARQVETTDDVEFVPALTGLGAPYWDQNARGIISGLTRGTQRAHIARATLEGMALQNLDVLVAMEKDSRQKLKKLKVDGGASANGLLMQLQSDYLDVEITRPKVIETTSAGAAFLAGLGAGLFKDLKEIQKIWKVDRVFKPTMSKKARRERLKKWHLAIRRARLS